MIKKLQKIGNSKGLVLDKPLLKLFNLDSDDSVEVLVQENGLLIKKVEVKAAYSQISKSHRKSLDKLGE